MKFNLISQINVDPEALVAGINSSPPAQFCLQNVGFYLCLIRAISTLATQQLLCSSKHGFYNRYSIRGNFTEMHINEP